MGFVLDTGPLLLAIRQKADLANKAWPEVVNKAMKDVALRSIAHTPRVPAATISEAMQRHVATRFATKTGRRLKRRRDIHVASTFAVAIMTKRLRDKGTLAGVTAAEIRQMALKMAAARVRSASYLRAGWLAAAQPFGLTGGQDTHLYHAPGEGTLATEGNLLATLSNRVPTRHWKDSGGGQAAYAAAQRALQAGVDATTADLLKYIDQKLAAAGFSGGGHR